MKTIYTLMMLVLCSSVLFAADSDDSRKVRESNLQLYNDVQACKKLEEGERPQCRKEAAEAYRKRYIEYCTARGIIDPDQCLWLFGDDYENLLKEME